MYCNDICRKDLIQIVFSQGNRFIPKTYRHAVVDLCDHPYISVAVSGLIVIAHKYNLVPGTVYIIMIDQTVCICGVF